MPAKKPNKKAAAPPPRTRDGRAKPRRLKSQGQLQLEALGVKPKPTECITWHSLLTPEVYQEIVKHVSEGTPPRIAAEAAGVSKSNFDRWMVLARNALVLQEEDGIEPVASDQAYINLLQDIMKAQALVRAAAVRHWKKEFPRDWRSCVSFLERQVPDEFGKKDKLTVDANVTQDVKNEEDEFRKKLEADPALRKDLLTMLRKSEDG